MAVLRGGGNHDLIFKTICSFDRKENDHRKPPSPYIQKAAKEVKLKKVIHFLCAFSTKGTDYTVKLIHVAVIMMRVPELINSEFPRITG